MYSERFEFDWMDSGAVIQVKQGDFFAHEPKGGSPEIVLFIGRETSTASIKWNLKIMAKAEESPCFIANRFSIFTTKGDSINWPRFPV